MLVFSSAYGGWIGLIFSENEELPAIEIIIYNIEHFLASFGGPLILYMCGRYDPFKYATPAFVNGGYMFFTIYMRWFLCPISLYTWANLNHTLCGVSNDPFFALINDESYYFWAELYLMFSCYVGIYLNLVIIYIVSTLLSPFYHKEKTN